MTAEPRERAFVYDGLARRGGTITCTYRTEHRTFQEVATFEGDLETMDGAAIDALAELYFLLAGLSYYKTTAARSIEAPGVELGPADVALLRGAICGGLAEFALRNALDLSDVELPAPRRGAARAVATPGQVLGPLIPFGGGIDSIVTVLTSDEDAARLFVVSPPTGRFDAIERPAALTGLPVLRCTRTIDPALRQPDPGWRNGHVPVTAIVSALALVAATADGHREVRMSNERSSSAPTTYRDGQPVNHQWSKSLECELLLDAAVSARVESGPRYRSALRDRSELWVAREFSRHPEYFEVFMSCNRAFRQSPSSRAKQWCGECDKCLFTDLVLAPFLDRTRLEGIFAGREPLGDPSRVVDLEVLVGLGAGPRPFECVGDVDECRAALVATCAREDRASQRHLAQLAGRLGDVPALETMLGGDPVGPRAARDLV